MKKRLILDEAVNIREALVVKKKTTRGPRIPKAKTGETELAKLKRENRILKKRIKELESRPEKTKVIRISDSGVAESRLRTIKYKDKEIRELKDKIQQLKSCIEIYAAGGVPINDEIVLAGKRIAVRGELIKDIKIRTKNGINYVMRSDLETVASKIVVKYLLSEYRKR